MDAISFVMGERPANLRVKRLTDLVYGANVNKPVSDPTSVTAVFEVTKEGNQNSEQVQFTRSITNGRLDYDIDGVVS